jgi:hypothetical protein
MQEIRRYYFEDIMRISEAVAAERQLKKGLRAKGKGAGQPYGREFSMKATTATLLVSKLFYRLLDRVSIVVMSVAFLGMAARAAYDAGIWWKTAHTSGYSNAELLYEVGITNQQTGFLGLQQILDEVLDWPAWTGLLIAGVILLAINAMAKATLRDVEQRLDWEKGLTR